MRKVATWVISTLLAGGLLITGIVAGSQAGHGPRHTTLTAASSSGAYANLDSCPSLAEGDQSECVQELQSELDNDDNAGLAVDGTFGPATQQAVMDFQQQHSLTADGVVGPATLAALDDAASGNTNPAPAASSAAPATQPTTSGGESTGESLCKGVGGVASNLLGAATGSLNPAIIGEPDLGTPYLDGVVIRADSSVPFYSWGSCANQVEFQMQTKICGLWGCNWVTRNNGIPEFFWAHDDTGAVSQQVTMSCRPGTNSYRVQMRVTGLSSSGDLNPENDEPEAIGAELDNDTEDGPVIKLTC